MSMNDNQRAKLLEIARKATPGPWKWHQVSGRWRLDQEPDVGRPAILLTLPEPSSSRYPRQRDLDYIAAFNPAVVIELLTENADFAAKLERERETFRRTNNELSLAYKAQIAQLEAKLERAEAALRALLHLDATHTVADARNIAHAYFDNPPQEETK